MRSRVLVDPLDLLVEGAGNQVEGDRRLGDLDVVDGPDRLGVAPLSEPNGVAHDGGRYRGGSGCRPVAILECSAPLAQSAEHFHGKEGVYGSSP